MKIISWNVKHALKSFEKINKLKSLVPDIAILQEVQLQNLQQNQGIQFEDFVWVGEKKGKGLGLGVVTFSKDYKLELLVNEIKYEWIMPVKVSGKENFTLIAVWAKRMPNASYGKVLYNALVEYENFIKKEKVIIMGDFNLAHNVSSSYTGLGGKDGFNKIMDLFSNYKLTSCYHHYFKEDIAMESKPTYYHYYDMEKPFHIDYCFVSEEFLGGIKEFSVGDIMEYLEFSNHVPLTLEVKGKEILHLETILEEYHLKIGNKFISNEEINKIVEFIKVSSSINGC